MEGEGRWREGRRREGSEDGGGGEGRWREGRRREGSEDGGGEEEGGAGKGGKEEQVSADRVFE